MHATRCAKTIDVACVLVYFSEFSKSQFRENLCFYTNFLTCWGGGIVVRQPPNSVDAHVLREPWIEPGPWHRCIPEQNHHWSGTGVVPSGQHAHNTDHTSHDTDRAMTMTSTICKMYLIECQIVAASSSNDLHMTPVGFEPTQLALVELESTPLDHSGKVSW